MDIINTTRPAPFGAVVKTIASNIFGGMVSFVISEFKANRTHKALSDLSPRQLEDIGLTPGDIAQASRPTTFLR